MLKKRIKTRFHWNLWNASVNFNVLWSDTDARAIEKFGELVVYECLSLIDCKKHDAELIKFIKDHFELP
jgi:hypothetical protein